MLWKKTTTKKKQTKKTQMGNIKLNPILKDENYMYSLLPNDKIL